MKRVPFYCELDKADSAKINRWARKGKMSKRAVVSLALTRLADTPVFSAPAQVVFSPGGGTAAVDQRQIFTPHGTFKRSVGT
jgi:hypothetical protein